MLLVRFPLLSAEDLLLSAQLRLLYQAVQVLQGLPLLTLVLVALLLLPPPPPPLPLLLLLLLLMLLLLLLLWPLFLLVVPLLLLVLLWLFVVDGCHLLFEVACTTLFAAAWECACCCHNYDKIIAISLQPCFELAPNIMDA